MIAQETQLKADHSPQASSKLIFKHQEKGFVLDKSRSFKLN